MIKPLKFVLKKANQCLGLLGYRVIKVPVFEDALGRLLDQNKVFCFMQVGAHDGVRFDSLYERITRYEISGVVIEPLSKYYKRLALNYEDYENVIPLNMALHSVESEIKLYSVKESALKGVPKWAAGIASVDPKHHLKSSITSENIECEVVPCKPLMNVIEEYGLSQMDLLQIDVEGYDFEILSMINFEEVKPKLIKYEYKNLNPMEKIDSVQLLKKNGYKVHIEFDDAIGVLKDTG